MLKKIAIALMLILPMGVAAQTLKFGHVASQEVVVLMPEYTKAMADLEKLQKQFTDELTSLGEEITKKYTEFQTAMQEGNLPQNIQERRQRELEDMVTKREEFERKAYQDMQEAQQQMQAPIFQKLENAIKEVGAAEGVVYIFDLSRTYIPYIDEKLSTDLTPKLKAKLGL